MTTVADQIMKLEEKLEAASERRGRTAAKYCDRLGWGTSEEVEKAYKAMRNAVKWYDACESSLKRLRRIDGLTNE